jgi:Ca-activated chloride channel family protein
VQPRLPAIALLASVLAGTLLFARQEQRPTFRGGTNRVSLNVVVKDGHGKPITNLVPRDFQVFDENRAVQLDDIGAGAQGVSIALLIDTSGSMALGPRLDGARQATEMLLAQFSSIDEAALFTFDRRLQEIVPFSTSADEIRRGFEQVKPYGSTSLHDAVAAAARQLASRPSPRRAVIAITDGLDNSSELTAAAASNIASSIDVPIYVLAVAGANRKLDPSELVVEPVEGGNVARLDELTASTGGASFKAEAPAETNLAVRHILSDLRSGYLLGFTPSDMPGWHRVTVRVARRDARVRTRAGFWMGASPF